ncbi:unnamed protein product [Mucor hiemalis]
MFIQSLDKPETRLTLFALRVTLKLDTIAKVIQQAIELETMTKLAEQPETIKTTPMDVDNYQKTYQASQRHSGGSNRNFSEQGSRSNNNNYVQLLAYDRNGNPICDFCRQKHRTVDCQQYNSNKSNGKHKFKKNKNQQQHQYQQDGRRQNHRGVHNVEIVETSVSQPSNQIEVHVNPASVDIAHLAQVSTSSSLPRTNLVIEDQEFVALWDTGAEITGIRKDIAMHIKVPIDTNNRVSYRDVNGNINYTVGVAT